MKKLCDMISYLPMSTDPLSADVFVIRGEKRNYVFDVGSSDTAFSFVEEMEDPIIIISHFHDDHMKNLYRLTNEDIYLGKESYKHLKKGHVTQETVRIDDGISFEIVPIPSSHCKGSLGLNIDHRYFLIGDSLGSRAVSNERTYNQQLLKSEIDLFRKIDAQYLISSHEPELRKKEEVIDELEKIYSFRNKNDNLIIIK